MLCFLYRSYQNFQIQNKVSSAVKTHIVLNFTRIFSDKMLKKCCFCVNLERGCLIIGLIDLICGVIGILDSSIYRKEQNAKILFFLPVGTCIAIAGALALIVGVQKVNKFDNKFKVNKQNFIFRGNRNTSFIGSSLKLFA